jgi:hypothetical protein
LALVQQWGKSFTAKRAELPGFYQTYIGLKTKGADFPVDDGSGGVPVFTPPPAMFEEVK